MFGVFSQNNAPTFRDGKPWPDAILDGEGRGPEAGYKTVNARTLWDNAVLCGRGAAPAAAPAAGVPPAAIEWEKQHAAKLDDAELKRGLRLLWFGTGTDDFLMPTTRATVVSSNGTGSRRCS